MFCPKCATQNVEGASYCRSCGVNSSLVPKALTGQLTQASPPDDEYYSWRRRRRGGPSMDYAIRTLSLGIAFSLIIAMTSRFAPGGSRWWFWLLIPTIMFFSRGFSELIRVNRQKNLQAQAPRPLVNAVRTPDLPPAKTAESMTPVPSVTEETTRHLGAPAQTRPFDFSDSQKPS